MMEQLTQEEHLKQMESVESDISHVEAYSKKVEGRQERLHILLETIEDPVTKTKLKQRLERVGKIARGAIAGTTFLLASQTAFGQETQTIDSTQIDQTPQITAPADLIEKEAGKDEKKALDASLSVIGEALQTEAEKLQKEAPSSAPTVVDELAKQAKEKIESIDLKDPLVLANLASKLGGDIGRVGEWAKYAQESYKTLNTKDYNAMQEMEERELGEEEVAKRKAEQETRANIDKVLSLASSIPGGGNVAKLAQLAKSALSLGDKMKNNKEKVTAGEVFKTILGLHPAANMLLKGVDLLKLLPETKASTQNQNELYRN